MKMIAQIVLAVLVFCVVTDDVRSEENYGRNYKMPEYVRIKRAKYYSNPPMRFYRRPPAPHVVKGIFSYTPPPNVMEHDNSPPPGSYRPSKVSKRHPTPNDGLGENDINNLVKHLSKQDLDKIIEFAGERYKESPFEKYSSPNNVFVKETDDVNIYNPNVREFDANQKFSSNGPYVSGNGEQMNQDIEYSGSSQLPKKVLANVETNGQFTFRGPYAHGYNEVKSNTGQGFYSNQPQNYKSETQDFSNVPLDTQESMKNNQFSFVDSYIQQELYTAPTQQTGNAGNIFTDSKVMQEEQLPKPVNLREDNDYDVSNSDQVPSVVKASSYKTENFGQLPLMDYSSKLDSVSSYHVPHYSVISQQAQQYSSSSQLSPSSSPSAKENKAPKLELAPEASAAKDQSDAHLKAIKIWTHRSKGTAYTLHDDGTLSLEKGRPKPYGFP